MPAPEYAAAIAGMHGLISVGGGITETILSGAEKLRIIANIGAGYDGIDLESCTKRRIAVTNTPGVLTESTADFTFALLLAVTRRILEADRYVREGDWKEGRFDLLWGSELHAKVLGIYGLGKIGQAVARRGRAFGMKILYYSRRRASRQIEDETSGQMVGFSDLLHGSDVLSIHAPLNSDSTLAIGASQFAMLKPGSVLINTARGKIVDEQAMVEALKSGQLAGAGLDVFENEPTIHSALLEAENVVLAPHIASATKEGRLRMATLAADNLLAFFDGRRPPNVLNPEVME